MVGTNQFLASAVDCKNDFAFSNVVSLENTQGYSVQVKGICLTTGQSLTALDITVSVYAYGVPLLYSALVAGGITPEASEPSDDILLSAQSTRTLINTQTLASTVLDASDSSETAGYSISDSGYGYKSMEVVITASGPSTHQDVYFAIVSTTNLPR